MSIYEFTLKFGLAGLGDAAEDDEADDIVERLAEAGCEDALVGTGRPGRIVLDFSREAACAYDAVSSAVADVKRALPAAKLIEAAPDLVGLTEVAEILRCSRQNVRKIMLSNSSGFPEPVHEGKSSLWHLASVLTWLKDNKSYKVAEGILEIAMVNRQLNIARELSTLGRAERRAALSIRL